MKKKGTGYSRLQVIGRQEGFTLLELLVAATITIIMAGLLFGVFVQSNSTFYIQRNKVNQSTSLTDSLKTINDLIKISSAVVNQYVNGSTTYTSNLSTMVLQLPAIDGSGNNLLSDFDYAVISQDATNSKILRLQIFVSASSFRKAKNQILSTDLSKVNFFYYDNNGSVVSPALSTRVNITLNTWDQSGLSTKPSSASSDINLRNN